MVEIFMKGSKSFQVATAEMKRLTYLRYLRMVVNMEFQSPVVMSFVETNNHPFMEHISSGILNRGEFGH